MKTRAVLFDLDGVLVRTDEYHCRSWAAVAVEHGIPFDPRTFDLRMRGLQRHDALTVLLQAASCRCLPPEQEALAARKDEIFRQLIARHGLPPAAGARPLLDDLRRHGLKTAVASSSRNARFVLATTGLSDALDAVVDGSDGPGKPQPDLFLLAAWKLGEPPEACVVVEDAVDGLEAAHRAGMAALAIGPAQRFGGVRHRCDSLAEVTVQLLTDIH